MSINEIEDLRKRNEQMGSVVENGNFHIDKNAIAKLPLAQYEGRIVVVTSLEEAKKAVKALSREKILGFDTETRPIFTRGEPYLVSLVQLCGSRAVYLFRLDYCGGVAPLIPLFENREIIKTGVAVRDDVRHLKQRAPFDDAGFVDSAVYSRRLQIENTGLRALFAYFFGKRISKNAQVSNWAALQLSEQQIVYAATDAWTSRELFLKLQALGVAPAKISQGSLFDAPATEVDDIVEEQRPAGTKKRRRRGPRRRYLKALKAAEAAESQTVPENQELKQQ
ncbi:MAG: 3'-5' exonuclease domain-containing protein 2 [Opitutales bacterium]|nr:3'-5' exonuclease domain-containing protein 2 [Opitutales bacterium]